MITDERIKEIKKESKRLHELWGVAKEHNYKFAEDIHTVGDFVDELIAALEAAQAELDDIKPWLIKYRESIFEDRATARELAKMLDWINANPNRKRAYELDTEVEE